VAYWLLKTEPTVYSFTDLERDKQTVWDGVAGSLAVKHLRAMKKGDEVFIYHTGEEGAIVGAGEVTGDPYQDPKSDDRKFTVIDIKPKQRLDRPVSLSVMKKDGRFISFDLIRISRLSVMPVTPVIWAAVLEISHQSLAR